MDKIGLEELPLIKMRAQQLITHNSKLITLKAIYSAANPTSKYRS